MDARVTGPCDFDRAQDEHVLRTFSLQSYPKTPPLCLAPFDELEQLGLEPTAPSALVHGTTDHRKS